jgi:hypothetical protein
MDLSSSCPPETSTSTPASATRSSRNPSGGGRPTRVSAAPLPVLGPRFDRQRDLTRFGPYATTTDRCAVRLFEADGTPGPIHHMELSRGTSEANSTDNSEGHPDDETESGLAGYFQVDVPGVWAGALYKMVLEGSELPDPYARRSLPSSCFLSCAESNLRVTVAAQFQEVRGGPQYVHRPEKRGARLAIDC